MNSNELSQVQNKGPRALPSRCRTPTRKSCNEKSRRLRIETGRKLTSALPPQPVLDKFGRMCAYISRESEEEEVAPLVLVLVVGDEGDKAVQGKDKEDQAWLELVERSGYRVG